MRCGLALFLILLCSHAVAAIPPQPADSTREERAAAAKTDKKNRPWGWVALPTFLYNTDIGFQFGALVEVYNYRKNRPIFPEYYHKLYAEVSFTTKGGSIFQLFYDSKHLVRDIRTTADITYLAEQALDFYGFNGYKSVFNPSWQDDGDAAYISRMFYRQQRSFLRIAADFQGKFLDPRLKWLAGLAFLQVETDTVDIDRLNRGKSDAKKLPDTTSLVGNYRQWNLIDLKESDGGMNNYLKLGLVWDTRDHEACPMRGLWSEAILLVSPAFTGDGDYGFIRLAVNHRQYFTLVKDQLSLVYRAGYLGTIAGKAPYYILPYQVSSYALTTTIDGVGGSQTLRGVMRNRVVGDGTALLNVELRWKFWHFRLLRSECYLAGSLYGDAGMVVQQRKTDLSSIPADVNRAAYFSDGAESPHIALGGGLHLALNRNTVVSADIGKPLNPQDGSIGFYLGLGWLF